MWYIRLSSTYEGSELDDLLSAKDLRELIDYDESTGIFSWKKKRRGIKTGVALGCDNGFGYLRITVLGKSYYAHRLAWLYVYGQWPKNEIDHINGIKNDNRIKNLRDISGIANLQNRVRCQKNSETQTLGVSWHKKTKKWQAHICVYKQRKYLGLFESIEDAHNEYLKEREKIKYENS